MAPRDYAKKPAQKKAQTPGWVWLLSGLALGLFVAFLVYLASLPTQGALTGILGDSEPSQRSEPAPKPKPQKRAAPEPAPKPEKESPKQKYDFYTILPEMEVAVPESTPGEGAKAPREEITDPGRYVVQVGSFKSAGDADSRKAELALLGIVSTIQTVTVDGDESWHRVRVGPIEELDRLEEVRERLRENGIEHLVLKEKG